MFIGFTNAPGPLNQGSVMLSPLRRAAPRAASLALFMVVVGMVGCASLEATLPLEKHLEEARQAQVAGDMPKALGILNKASRQYPASVQPWDRIGQIHFDAGNYGAAIVAAQEALQRDTNDSQAHSLIAVSGLRASMASLAQLRQSTANISSMKKEAEALAGNIRETLGQPLIAPAGNRAAKPAPVPPRRPAPVVSSRPEEAPSASSNNPFSALK
jgi:tetratricopeptide (TPR) repeat protein